MTNTDDTKVTGGFAGKIVGKAKEVAGSALGNDDLAREGRLQQAQAEAASDAKSHAAKADHRDEEAQLATEQTETALETARLETDVAEQQREDAIDADRQAGESVADAHERRAEHERLEAASHEADLVRSARRAESTAAAIDPEETR